MTHFPAGVWVSAALRPNVWALLGVVVSCCTRCRCRMSDYIELYNIMRNPTFHGLFDHRYIDLLTIALYKGEAMARMNVQK